MGEKDFWKMVVVSKSSKYFFVELGQRHSH